MRASGRPERFWAGLAGLLIGLAGGPAAEAGPIACLEGECGWSISVDGETRASGGFSIDGDGNIAVVGDPTVNGDGFTASITGVSGNVDPEIVFGLGATNTSNVTKTFSFAFSLPLGGAPVPIASYADLAGSLSSPSGGAAFLFPVLGTGTIVDSQDIAFSPFATEDKGVDLGGPLLGTAGSTVPYPVVVKTGSILTGGPYDVMSVVVAFGLTDPDSGPSGSGVGLSGIVRQTLIPEPGTLGLLLSGLVWLAVAGNRPS